MVKERPEGTDFAADYEEEEESDSLIQKFFEGKHVFVTGGTGFLGILIIEKLIRVCKVKKVYVLIRSKKGKSIQDRLTEILNGPVFEKLKNSNQEFKSKVQAVNGDCAETSLGLSFEDKKMVIETTEIVIHGAATVRFDEKLRLATHINIRGTLDLLKICKKMPNIQSFNYISTAYSNCIEDVIEEKIFPPAMSFEKLISLVDESSDNTLEKMTTSIIGNYPNTYVFTKQIAESVVQSFSNDLPVSIVRPSQIVATAKEPIAGWINNVYGVTGIIVGAAIGLLRVLLCDYQLIIDAIPADFVINAVLAATHDVGRKHQENPKYLKTSNLEIPVYNVVSGARNPLNGSLLLKCCLESGYLVPSVKCIWVFNCITIKNYYLFCMYEALVHFFPAAIADLILIILRKKPIFWKIYKKIHKGLMVFSYFTMRSFNMPDDKTVQLYKGLASSDKKTFNFEVTSFNWPDFFYFYVRGLRLYIVNDPLETIPEGRKHYFKLQVCHYTLLTVLAFLLIWFIILPAGSILGSVFGF